MSFIIPQDKKSFSNNHIRKAIKKFYCVINAETYGIARIERDPLRTKYKMHERFIYVYFPPNIKIRRVINEVVRSMNLEQTIGKKTPYHGLDDSIFAYGDTEPNLIITYQGQNEYDEHVYRFSFDSQVILEKT